MTSTSPPRDSDRMSQILLKLTSQTQFLNPEQISIDNEEMEDKPTMKYLCKNFFKLYWRYLFTFIWPIVTLPICIGPHMITNRDNRSVFKCIYILFLVTGYWATQCIPIYMTGLIPCFMFPALDIMPSSLTNSSYFKDLNMMIFCNMILILSLEKTELHRKIGLVIIKHLGLHMRFIHFVVMCSVFFFSFWIPNAILTIMFCPIIKGIIKTFEELRIENFYKDDIIGSNESLVNMNSLGNISRSLSFVKSSRYVKSIRFNVSVEEKLEIHDLDNPTSLTKGYFLGLAYVANIGGAASLIGSGINVHYKELFEMVVPDSELSVFRWFLCNLPLSIILFLITWVWLQILYFGLLCKPNAETILMNNIKEYKDSIVEDLNDRYNFMNKLSWDQSWILALYILSLLLLFTKGNIFYKGWTHIFIGAFEEKPFEYIKSSAPFAIIVFFIFVIPNEEDGIGLVQWSTIQENMKWGLLFIIGGCFTIGTGIKESTFVLYIERLIIGLKNWNKFGIQCLLVLIGTLLSEVMSNSAGTLVFQPMIFNISKKLGLNPMYLGNIFTTALSYTFILPNGSPANNIVVAYANIQTIDILKAGIPLKIISYLLTILWFPTIGTLIWDDKKYLYSNTTILNTHHTGLKEYSDL